MARTQFTVHMHTQDEKPLAISARLVPSSVNPTDFVTLSIGDLCIFLQADTYAAFCTSMRKAIDETEDIFDILLMQSEISAKEPQP